ncbi:MAG TPA: hypothetical protein VKU36_00490 [Candidatus Babeliales bacterium]|nr:hypothetical protein [Candidatus Babeliales bacterium]
MNKLIIALTILFLNSTIFGMKRELTESPVIMLHDELKKRIVLDLGKNVHHYVHKNNPAQASDIILKVSFINKYFYSELEKERTDPVTTRQIIYNLKTISHPFLSESTILHRFKTLGAKKCINLSQQLYNFDKNMDNIETLIAQGALLNYRNKNALYIIQYAALNRSDLGRRYLKKLLTLGANPNVKAQYDPTALGIAINQQDFNKIALILKHNPHDKCWENAFDIANDQIFYFIMDNSTSDDLTQGLIVCIKRGYHPQLIKRFIKKGASIEQTLAALLEEKFNKFVYYNTKPINNEEPFTQSISYLLNHRKIDASFAADFKKACTMYESWKRKREENEQHAINNRKQIASSIKNYKRRKK